MIERLFEENGEFTGLALTAHARPAADQLGDVIGHRIANPVFGVDLLRPCDLNRLGQDLGVVVREAWHGRITGAKICAL